MSWTSVYFIFQLIAFFICASSFSTNYYRSLQQLHPSTIKHGTTVLNAKKRREEKVQVKKKGFDQSIQKSQELEQVPNISIEAREPSSFAMEAAAVGTTTKSYDQASEELFKKYLDKPTKRETVRKNKEDLGFGEEILSKVPEATLLKIDKTLIAATFFSLAFVVSCGVGMLYLLIVTLPSYS
jgi:vacuolar-type H+-ATPase subunit B/Vma2